MKPSVRNVLTDTGSSMILGYYEDIEEIMATICEYVNQNLNAKCSDQTKKQQFYITGCSSSVIEQIPDIKLQIDSFEYVLRSEKFLTSKKIDNKEHCIFNMHGTTKPIWILGTPFLNDFYQVYDLKRNQVGLAPSKYTQNMQVPKNVDETFTCRLLVVVSLLVLITCQSVRNIQQNIKFVKMG